MKFFLQNVPSVFLMSLVLLASAQKTSNNLRDVDYQELARQNKITKQILEAFIQKKLGLASNVYRPPSIFDILPGKKPEERPVRQSVNDRVRHPDQEELNLGENEDMHEEIVENVNDEPEQIQDTPEYFDALQSVESEQIDSIYSEGRSKKYSSQSLDNDLEPGYRKNNRF